MHQGENAHECHGRDVFNRADRNEKNKITPSFVDDVMTGIY